MQATGSEPRASLQRLQIKLEELISSLEMRFGADLAACPVATDSIPGGASSGTEKEPGEAQVSGQGQTATPGPETEQRPGRISRWISRIFG